MSRYASRKFLLSAATLAAASVLVWFDHLSATLWRDVVLGTVGVYVAGNVAQKATAKGE